MYNRYIPQSDGSFRRSRIQEKPSMTPPTAIPTMPPRPMPEPEPEYCPPQESPCEKCPSRSRPFRPPEQAGNFLKNLLPQGLDTEDLMVVLLLLLMSGDCREDRNLPLLTLALYLFL